MRPKLIFTTALLLLLLLLRRHSAVAALFSERYLGNGAPVTSCHRCFLGCARGAKSLGSPRADNVGTYLPGINMLLLFIGNDLTRYGALVSSLYLDELKRVKRREGRRGRPIREPTRLVSKGLKLDEKTK